MRKIIYLLFAILIVSTVLVCCAHKNTGRRGVEAAMQRYDALLLKMDADSIAQLFTPDGKLGEMRTGRDSIKSFLQSFTSIKVLYQRSTPDSTSVTGDSAVQSGHYKQIDVISSKDTLRVAGRFTTKWKWLPEGGWHIKQITTTPE